MFMKKIVYTILVGFLFYGSLFAGGQKENVTVVRIWSNDAHNKDEYVKYIDAWNASEGSRKGIRIELTVYGGDHAQVLDIATQANELPELFKANDRIPSLISQDKIIPLTELPNFQSVLDEYAPYQMENLSQFNGKPYAIPLNQQCFGQITNTDLLKQAGFNAPPRTWAEFEQAAIAISKLNPGKVYGMALPVQWDYFREFYIMVSATPSIGGFQWDFTNGRYQFSKLVPFFEMIQRINRAGGMFPGAETLSDDVLRAQFAEGNIGMIMGSGSFNVGVLYDQFPSKVPWEESPIPVQDINNYYKGQAVLGALYTVSKRAKDEGKLDAVAEVYKMICSRPFREELYTAAKDIPVNSTIAVSAKPPVRRQWNAFATIGANTVLKPTIPDEMFQVEGDDYYTVFSKITLLQANPASALADLDRRYQAAFEQVVNRGIIKREDFINPDIETAFKIKQ
jgi:multiple sugar transport system substrate-binding protein